MPRREFQAAFFQRMGGPQQFQALFEHLPDVDFFAKDAQGRFVAASAGTLWRAGVRREEDLLGLDDHAIHPPNIARGIREDDLEVMRTRSPLIDRVEALFARTRAKDWFLTTKLPIYDVQGEVIGIMGYVRPYRGAAGGVMDPRLERVVRHLHEHYAHSVKMADLAKIAHLSERQLNRRFQDTFRMSAQEFLVRTRIQAASDALLETDKAVAEIATESGFYDQSAFTRQFRKHIGETPLVFRRLRARTSAGDGGLVPKLV
jgi:AraC-like DNA-binding protein